MTKQLTRQEVEAVVEILADKTLSRGQTIEYLDTGIPVQAFVIHSRRAVWGIANLNAVDLESTEYKVLGHHITIGTVLEKIDNTVGGRNYYIGQTTYNDELIHLWSRCGELTQSLQEIIEVSGWKEVRIPPEGWDEEQGGCRCHINPPCSFCEYSTYEEVLTSPEANALFKFLQNII